MRVLELYSGIGGMHYAFRESGVGGNIVAAIDINTVANEVYKSNFPNVFLVNKNIQSLDIKQIEKLDIDTILMSPPCQPFTRVGLQKDMLDNRTLSFSHVLSLIPQIESLRYILVENVKGFEKSEMRKELLTCLDNSNFNYKELILSPCQFGIPNTRHRYYLLAKKNGLKFYFDNSELQYSLPEELLQIMPSTKHFRLAEKDNTFNPKSNRKCYKINNILETGEQTQYLIPPKMLQKHAWVLDIRTPDSNGSCCFTKAYGHYIEGTGSVYCPLSEDMVLNKYKDCEKYEKSSEEQLKILNDLRLRFFTPKEVCSLMCFPDDFTFPKEITNKQKYRLLGNSINVHVVSRLIFLLYSEVTNI